MRDGALIALAILAHAFVPRMQAPPLVMGVIGWLLVLLTASLVVLLALRGSSVP